MHQADLKHPDRTLEQKLYALYNLSRDKKIDLSFRPPYLELLEGFGNPHLNLPPVIHVAGTNGKGSIVAMLRTMLEAAGHKVHAYTSPHLQRFNERLYLAGENIDDAALEVLIDEALALNSGQDVTFFEITTAMAFAAFSRAPADFTLLEVGLGGRLDCTNVVENPLACIINTISYDHMEFLGNSLTQIASEKAGIMKPGVPCIIGPQTKQAQQGGVMDVFEERASACGAPLYVHGVHWFIEPQGAQMRFQFEQSELALPQPNLPGPHQIDNAGSSLAALYAIKNKHDVSEIDIAKSMRAIDLSARLERITQHPLPPDWELWLDGGHNDSAGQALGQQVQIWNDHDGKNLHIILGMKADKDPHKFLEPLLPHLKSLHMVEIGGVGGNVSPEDVAALVQTTGTGCTFTKTDNIKTALHDILKTNTHTPGKVGGRILICGSLYLAEQVYK